MNFPDNSRFSRFQVVDTLFVIPGRRATRAHKLRNTLREVGYGREFSYKNSMHARKKSQNMTIEVLRNLWMLPNDNKFLGQLTSNADPKSKFPEVAGLERLIFGFRFLADHGKFLIFPNIALFSSKFITKFNQGCIHYFDPSPCHPLRYASQYEKSVFLPSLFKTSRNLWTAPNKQM